MTPIRIATGITSDSGAKLAISFLRSDLQKSAGVPRSIELFCRSDRRKMMVGFDARIGSYFGHDPKRLSKVSNTLLASVHRIGISIGAFGEKKENDFRIIAEKIARNRAIIFSLHCRVSDCSN